MTPMIIRKAILAACIALASFAAAAQDRLPTISPADYNAEQAKAAEEFLAARKTPVFGPFEPLMYSPNLMNLARGMGDYLRYKPSIGNTLSELAILITAREWTQDYEWYVHYPIALKAGIKRELADRIALGQVPEGMSEDEALIYRFAWELNRNKRVSDEAYAKVETRFGKQGAVDLAGICGYYTFLAMELNMARYPIPGDGKLLPRLESAATTGKSK
jgi:4-carboxymuconolactone decarboxylase